MTSYDAVVLAGGAAKRLGGADKPGVRVGGRSLLDRVLAACADATTTVVVAERRPTARPVVWAREEPPGGGPLAALAAGLSRTTADTVLVLSADLPFLGERTVRRLLDALAQERPEGARADGTVSSGTQLGGTRPGGTQSSGTQPGRTQTGGAQSKDVPADVPEYGRTQPDGALLVDADGRDQPLVAVYRTEALRRGVERLAQEHGGLGGLPLRQLTGGLILVRVTEPGDSRAAFDCDTWEDIAEARARIREHEHVLDEWITAVKDELGIDLEVDTGMLLDLARDAAHGVARPAAPLTTFLVGYAAARAEGGPEAVAEAARKAAALAARWADEDKPDDRPAGGTGADAAPDAG